MSSATQYVAGAARQTIQAASGRASSIRVADDRVRNLGLSPRQLALNVLWARYRCQQYDNCSRDWDGREVLGPLETEQVGLQGFLPQGFTDMGGQTLPLKFRRPSAPFHLVHLVVNRFTGLLFSEKRHPQYRVPGDDATTEWLGQWAKAARLWPTMIQARNFGGAQGTSVLTFSFVGGRPDLEVHDPRWCIPTFRDRTRHLLRSLEVRYQFPVEVRDPERGWVEVPHWYRRVVDEHVDTLWKPQPVGEGDEPDWADPRTIEARVEHDLGFFPGRWVQNLPVQESVDGDPDCHGAYDTFAEVDRLISQGNRALFYNGDPTPVFSTDAAFAGGEVQLGSGTSLKFPSGCNASFLEISGSSITAINAQAEGLERRGLQICECVLERPDGAGPKTATEVDRLWSSMLAKADKMREQYGGCGLIPMGDDAARAARKLGEPREVADGDGVKVVVYAVRLPRVPVKDEEGKVTGWRDPQLPEVEEGGESSAQADLAWPRYLEPGLQDAQLAVQAAAGAKLAALVDAEAATAFVSEYFDVEDPKAMLARAKKEGADKQAATDAQTMAAIGGRRGYSGDGGF